MIELHQFKRALGLPNPSPFCLKVETYLRLSGQEHEIVTLHDPRKTPKGKAPFLVDGDKTIADSHFILDHLKAEYGDPLGDGLSPTQKAHHHALARMIEEHSYFIVVVERWLTPHNAPRIEELWFGGIPKLIRGLVFSRVQKDLRRTIWGQGLLRHTEDERFSLFQKDMEALAAALGDADYFGGGTPREIDAVAFATLANILVKDLPGPLQDIVLASPNLVDYTKRMGTRIFPDFFNAEKMPIVTTGA